MNGRDEMSDPIAHYGSEAAVEAAEALLRDGVVGLERLWPASQIDDLRQSLRKVLPGAFDMEAPRPEDVWIVGTRRLNGLVPIAGAMRDCVDLLQHPALLTLLDQALGENWVYESFGIITSFPGATLQQLHSDNPNLYADTSFAGKLPPFALTISFPLVDVNEHNGSTEFLLGSHHLAEAPPTGDGTVTREVARGDCMIWNYLVRHRGQANSSDAPRPMLYATACRSFWQDSSNFVPDARKLVLGRDALARVSEDRLRHFVRAKPMPGARTAVKTINRLVRWYAPGFHRAMRRLARRPENPL